MSSIDQLSIDITASASNATEAIDSLIHGLGNLSEALGMASSKEFSSLMESISKAATNVNSNLAKVGDVSMSGTTSGLSKMAESAAKASKQVEELNKALDDATGDKQILPPIEKDIGNIEAAVKNLREFKQTIKDMESGKIEWNTDTYNEAIRQVDALTNSVKNYKNALKEDTQIDIGENVSTEAEQTTESIGGLIQKLNEAKKAFSDMNTGKVKGFSDEEWLSAKQTVESLTEQVNNYKKALEEVSKISADDTGLKDLDEQISDLNDALDDTQSSLKDISGTIDDDFGEATKNAGGTISELTKQLKEAQTVLSQMESGKGNAFSDEEWLKAKNSVEMYGEELKKAKEALTGVNKKTGNLKLPTDKQAGTNLVYNLQVLGNELDKVSQKFNQLATIGVKTFRVMASPLTAVALSFKTKLKGMMDSMSAFKRNIKANLDNISKFWARAMRTFTFMLVRKAIDAVIKSVNEGIQSMAKFSNQMGTEFNKSISLLVADFSYLGRSIVSIFAPLLNAVIPVIDAIINKLAELFSYIGMVFAALTGASSFTKAKKNVDNYANSLNKASKSAKTLTMGIDELNILNDKSGGGGGGGAGDFMKEWEEVKVPDWAKEMADNIKKVAKDIFNPLKTAWDDYAKYLKNGLKTLWDALKRLFGSIGRDFLDVWNQPQTIQMFKNILGIVGDLMRVVRNLADAFTDAWNRNKVGKKILENIRDILAILVRHARNVSYYMIGWSKNIDFYPMLKSFEELTRKLERVAEFMGGVFEDIMIEGVLKYIKFIIEEEIPLLNESLSSIVDAFNFDTLRANLKPLWSAFEEVLENISIGFTKAFKNIGVEVARFTSSKVFTDFLNSLVKMAKLITANRVEKVLTGIGLGILEIVKALMKFVNSKPFQDFLEMIAKWIDKASTKDIANIFVKLAKAIILFKFTAFTASKLSGFFSFLSALASFKNGLDIAKSLKKTADGVEVLVAASKGTPEVAEKASSSLSKLFTSFKNVKEVNIGEAMSNAKTSIAGLVESLKNVNLKDVFTNTATSVKSFVDGLSLAQKAVIALGVGLLEFKTVSGTVKNISTGVGDLTSNIVKLTAEVGVAAGAFTLLLGFPAGIIAAGCVAAVAAIKGINEAIDQINIENITSAVRVEGDTTIGKVKDWYAEVTKAVDESIEKMNESTRKLEQGRGDIESYSKTIEGMNIAIKNSDTVTSGMADKLIGKYENLQNAIESYIDESTDALVSNLLAQRDYLMAQGVNVDQMIADIYKNAEKQKKSISDAIKGVKEAVKGLDGLKEGTKAYNDQMKKVVEATTKASSALSEYGVTAQNIDVSETIEQLDKLGSKLDLSQYTANEEGWTKAAEDIKSGIDNINSAYTTKMSELEASAKDAKDQIDLMPGFTDEQKETAKAAIDETYNEIKNTLTSKTEEALGVYKSTIEEQYASVAAAASEEWDKNSNILKNNYATRASYITAQLKQYSEKMVKEGVEDSLKSAYDKIPGSTEGNLFESMSQISLKAYQAYNAALNNRGKDFAESTVNIKDFIKNGLNNLDFANEFVPAAKNLLSSWNESVKGLDFTDFGKTWSTLTGQSIAASKQEVIDASKLVSGEGSAAFSNEYIETLTKKLPLIDKLVKIATGNGKSYVEGFNKGITGNISTTEASINQWAKDFDESFHTNPFIQIYSPSRKAKEYGKNYVEGFNRGLEENNSNNAINKWVESINTSLKNGLDTIKTTIKGTFSEAFSIDIAFDTKSFDTITTNLIKAVTNAAEVIGTALQTDILPNFMTTYVTPFFMMDNWNAPFTELFVGVFETKFEEFSLWFSERMQTWWDESLLIWFEVGKWTKSIFDPLMKIIKEQFEQFQKFWDKSMNTWWDAHVVPWFLPARWTKQFNIVLDQAKKTFDAVSQTIDKKINDAAKSVAEACRKMAQSISDVAKAIDDLNTKITNIGNATNSIQIKIPKFAAGGYPTRGSLFLANEAGPELVGTMNGNSAVASNDEITGIRDAVLESGNVQSELLNRMVMLTQAILDKDPVIIGDRELARIVDEGNSQLGMSIIT